MKKVLLTSFVLLLLAACQPKEKIRDVEFYRSHASERQAMLKACRSHARKSQDINCQNAVKAQRLEEVSKTGTIKL